MREKRWNYSYKIAQQINCKTRREPNPLQKPPSCPVSWTNLWTTLVTACILKCICLYCLVRNWISTHHMLPTQAWHCNLAYILLVCSISQYSLISLAMSVGCSSVAKLFNIMKKVLPQVRMQLSTSSLQICKFQDTAERSNIARSVLLKLLVSLPDREKYWARRCSSVIPELLSAITRFSDHQTMPCQHIGERSISNVSFSTEKKVSGYWYAALDTLCLQKIVIYNILKISHLLKPSDSFSFPQILIGFVLIHYRNFSFFPGNRKIHRYFFKSDIFNEI